MMFQRYYKAAYIIVDSGCPLSLVGKAIVENHIKIFKFGENHYNS